MTFLRESKISSISRTKIVSKQRAVSLQHTIKYGLEFCAALLQRQTEDDGMATPCKDGQLEGRKAMTRAFKGLGR